MFCRSLFVLLYFFWPLCCLFFDIRCTDNTVEDERHFLFSCNYHTQEREALMSIINENCKNFSLLNVDAKLVWLLNNENIAILCALCTFLKHI